MPRCNLTFLSEIKSKVKSNRCRGRREREKKVSDYNGQYLSPEPKSEQVDIKPYKYKSDAVNLFQSQWVVRLIETSADHNVG